MADRASIEVVTSAVAILGVPSPESVALEQKEIEEILAPPLTAGQSGSAFMISSPRDQIEVVFAGKTLAVRDLSGHSEFSQSKVPAVLDFFVRRAAPRVSSYRVDFTIVVRRPEAEQWVRDNIFANQVSVKTQKKLLGGSAMLRISADPKTWNVSLQPKDDNKIIVEFGATEDTQEVPGQVDLRKQIGEQFESMLRFLTGLGL